MTALPYSLLADDPPAAESYPTAADDGVDAITYEGTLTLFAPDDSPDAWVGSTATAADLGVAQR